MGTNISIDKMCVIKLNSFAFFSMKERSQAKMKSPFEMIYFYFLTLLTTILTSGLF